VDHKMPPDSRSMRPMHSVHRFSFEKIIQFLDNSENLAPRPSAFLQIPV
jgi:hypothetical protein